MIWFDIPSKSLLGFAVFETCDGNVHARLFDTEGVRIGVTFMDDLLLQTGCFMSKGLAPTHMCSKVLQIVIRKSLRALLGRFQKADMM